MRWLLLVSLLVLSSCEGGLIGAFSSPQGKTSSGPFDKYVSKFYQKMGEQGLDNSRRDIAISFDENMDMDFVGLCHWGETPRRITINKYWWDGYEDDDRELLIFHELGHCVLNRSHNNDLSTWGRPVSIMENMGELWGWEYKYNYNSYIEELFQVSPANLFYLSPDTESIACEGH